MLVNLNIKNIALISEAHIEFCKGLNILSGETGAGKSVILDCINFVLGAKADKTMIRHGEDFCSADCIFTDVPEKVNDILRDYDIEVGDELLIKRKFDVRGNGYIKLNGENITAAMLKKLTAYLMDVHGQSEHFLLLSKSNQLECIDNVAKTDDIIEELKKAVSELSITEKELENLGGNADERATKIDILNYQINEIESAQIREGEKEELLILKDKINNLEKLSNALGGACCALTDENGAIDSILTAGQAIKSISDLGDEYQSIYHRILAIREEISDIGDNIEKLRDDLGGDLPNIDEIESRIELYRNFSRKYGDSVEEITQFLNNAKDERDKLQNFEENMSKLLKTCEKQRIKAYDLSKKLSDKRKKSAENFAKKVKEKLAELAMPSAQFLIAFEDFPKIEEVKNFMPHGLDKIEFMFSANAGEPVKPLSKIISGGEMSRFMLALKTQSSGGLETYIFDEIDAGISGKTAKIIANQFAEIAKSHQVIAISHLAQIAAMSDQSLLIEKNEANGKTFTNVRALSGEEKRNEIIRLIGGESDDEIAIKHAENMLSEAELYKKSL